MCNIKYIWLVVFICIGGMGWDAPAKPIPGEVDIKATVEADLAFLQQAEEFCAIDTGYYVSLETLNDRTSQPTLPPVYDYINNEGGTWVIRPETGQFREQRVNLVTAFLSWQGPYITYQSGRTQLGTVPYDQGSPLDPWGNPYLFYTPLGLVRGDSGSITLQYHGDRFDRPTIVSLGPDGIVSNDDAIRQFGSGIQITVISSIIGPHVQYRLESRDFTAPHGSALTIRGRNFGDTQGTSQVLFGATNLSANVTRWSYTSIDVLPPDVLTGTNDVVVKRNAGAPSNAQKLTLLPNAATDWALYK